MTDPVPVPPFDTVRVGVVLPPPARPRSPPMWSVTLATLESPNEFLSRYSKAARPSRAGVNVRLLSDCARTPFAAPFVRGWVTPMRVALLALLSFAASKLNGMLKA